MAIQRLITDKAREENKQDKQTEKEVRKKLKDLGLSKKHIDYILRKK